MLFYSGLKLQLSEGIDLTVGGFICVKTSLPLRSYG